MSNNNTKKNDAVDFRIAEGGLYEAYQIAKKNASKRRQDELLTRGLNSYEVAKNAEIWGGINGKVGK